MVKLTIVKVDDLYQSIDSFVTDNKVVVSEYDDMIKTILRMIAAGYCFAMDRDLLRDAMESMTYMYAPEDDMNRDRVVCQLEDDGDDSDSEDGEDGECNGMGGENPMESLMRMMGGLGGAGGMPGMPSMPDMSAKETCDKSGCPGKSECLKEECKESNEPEDILPAEPATPKPVDTSPVENPLASTDSKDNADNVEAE